MGVDQKRPLAGFALVAVLCAVLMTLSVSRGWGLDLIHPGRPIVSAGQAEKAPHDRRTAEPLAGVTPVSVPVELSAQPLGTASGAMARAAGSHARPVRATGRSVTPVRSTSTGGADEQTDPEVEDDTTQTESEAQREADKAQRHAEREAAKAQRHAERDAAKTARQAEHDAAKAAREAEHAAVKAAREAEREAAKAAQQAEREAAKAVRDAERQAAEAARDAAKAARHP